MAHEYDLVCYVALGNRRKKGGQRQRLQAIEYFFVFSLNFLLLNERLILVLGMLTTF